jgi:hypothetical protein
MTTFQELRQKNPQLQDQYTRFASQQGASGKPDWEKFREYMRNQGQTDPGADEPSDLQQVHQQATSQGGQSNPNQR